MSSTLPCRVDSWPEERVETRPPTVATGSELGKCPRVSPRWLRRRSSSIPFTPACARTRRSASSIMMPSRAVRFRTRSPGPACIAPQTPLSSPLGTTRRPLRSSAQISSRVDGRSVSGPAGVSPARARMRPSGQRSLTAPCRSAWSQQGCAGCRRRRGRSGRPARWHRGTGPRPGAWPRSAAPAAAGRGRPRSRAGRPRP